MRKIDLERFTTANHQALRSTNRAIVLNFIRYHQPISRAEIAHRTGLQRSTVSLIVDELIDRGFILEQRATSLRRGGVPRLLSISVGNDFIIGIDIEVSHSTVVLADLMGRMIERDILATPAEPVDVVAALADSVGKLTESVRKGALRSVGIAVSGLIDHGTGTVLLASNLGWSNFPLGQKLRRRLGVNVFVDNESNLSALAEVWNGDFSNRSCPDLVFVNVKEGIGSGIVIEGQVHRGFSSVGAEFGHMIIQPDGPKCHCGNHGCWETLADDRATLSRFSAGSESKSLGRTVSPPNVTIQEVIQKALAGDPLACAAVTETARYLALGIQNIVVALSPEFVVIAGAIIQAWPLLAGEIQVQLGRGMHGLVLDRTRIIPTSLQEKPSLVGAVSLGVAECFGLPTSP